MIDEQGSGLAHEYYDIMLYDVTWLVKQNVCLSAVRVISIKQELFICVREYDECFL